ncbi:hypothetical protein Glove_557g52 [Diversispora epigaea]|uniref:Uncharacterized protein n=1 Tax=Diversispora epigaea TaxID=1348612 RepID=A0A397GE85_9GLOM|nr:hypothetical protein Glove_557g52 [Diversispora epigaea]
MPSTHLNTAAQVAQKYCASSNIGHDFLLDHNTDYIVDDGVTFISGEEFPTHDIHDILSRRNFYFIFENVIDLNTAAQVAQKYCASSNIGHDFLLDHNTDYIVDDGVTFISGEEFPTHDIHDILSRRNFYFIFENVIGARKILELKLKENLIIQFATLIKLWQSH